MITEWMSEEGLQKRAAGGDLGGTMRLGAYPAKLDGNSVVRSIYGADEISERHRHRYEVNVHYRDALEGAGLIFSGMSPDDQLPEIVERPDHPWFIGVQFHPELKSRPFDPHPLFAGFIEAAVKQIAAGLIRPAAGTARGSAVTGAFRTTTEESTMLLTIAIILLILWALGFFAFHVARRLIHLLLVIGIIVLIWNFVAGRRAV